jgi:hypothetical protein
VQPVATGSRALDQLRVHQPLQQPLRLGLGIVEQPCDHRQAEVRSVGESEQRERRRRGLIDGIGGGRKLVERDVEAGADPHVHQLQFVEPALLVGQAIGQRPHRPGRPRRQPRRRHPQRQREPAAPQGDVLGGLRLGGDPPLARQAAEQGDRLLAGKDVEMQVDGAIQAAEHPPASHQHRAAWTARQQWRDLGGVAGVVQHHQQSPVGDQGAEPRRRLVQLRRDPPGVDAQRAEEAAEHLERLHRRQAGGGALEVDVQLAVGKPLGEPVRDVDSQRRLADPAHPADRRDDHLPAHADRVEQPVHLDRPAGEGRDVGGQLAWRGAVRLDRRRARHGPRPPRRCGLKVRIRHQDLALQALQVGTREQESSLASWPVMLPSLSWNQRGRWCVWLARRPSQSGSGSRSRLSPRPSRLCSVRGRQIRQARRR